MPPRPPPGQASVDRWATVISPHRVEQLRPLPPAELQQRLVRLQAAAAAAARGQVSRAQAAAVGGGGGGGGGVSQPPGTRPPAVAGSLAAATGSTAAGQQRQQQEPPPAEPIAGLYPASAAATSAEAAAAAAGCTGLLEQVCAAVAELGPRRERRHQGRALPAELSERLLRLLRATRWPAQNQRHGLSAERYHLRVMILMARALDCLRFAYVVRWRY
jgi:hypothetical protein